MDSKATTDVLNIKRQSIIFLNSGLDFKIDRVIKLIKAARSDLSQVTGGHLNIEEQIIRKRSFKYEINPNCECRLLKIGHDVISCLTLLYTLSKKPP